MIGSGRTCRPPSRGYRRSSSILKFRGPYRIVDPRTSRAGALPPNVLDLIYVKSGTTKSANVERLHLYHPSLDGLITDNANHHGGSGTENRVELVDDRISGESNGSAD